MPQCGDVREAKQTSLWCNDLCVCAECVCVCVTIRGQVCVCMYMKRFVAVRALT